ncbi:hypothetical protein [Evansella tamaricis]|uniref:Phage protein n=1 Tax=Evansella tamaricis TaxID=2069301 RepID=A0ABS6JDY5_9BACI|nr:hypothetical protein [Evansella tamaricis]MBU9711067.1 hypothetical protein [Evansella tamaricis]
MKLPKIKKGNRVLTVKEERLSSYLKQGYDQVDEKGEVVKRATGGKTISLGEYNKVVDELEKLKKTPANTDELNKQVEDLKAELKKVRTENTKLKKELEEK